MKQLARVAIVGRPNVGKSTLFNRITRKRTALVHSASGVTRDAQRMEAEWNGVAFEIVDTGGMFSGGEDDLTLQVESRALNEALGAALVVLVTDAETGIMPPDIDVADRIRRLNVPVLLAVNKVEKKGNRYADAEFFALGFEAVYPISALHGEGIGELLDGIVAVLPKAAPRARQEDLKLAIVGRPNVGKSSLINTLVGEDVNIVDSKPGTTRDSLDLSIRWHGRTIVLVDTAGIRRKARSKDGLESLTALKSIDAIGKADVVLLVLDASEGISNQDVKVASYAHKAGKGFIFCVNKWDLIEDKTPASLQNLAKEIRRQFAFATYAPVISVSALNAQRVSKILPLVWKVREEGRKRVPTSEVNRFVEAVVAKSPPPSHGGGNGKIYYATQVGVSPPTFSFFVNKRAFFGRSYLRFLNNRVRDAFGFEGTLIRIKLVEKERR